MTAHHYRAVKLATFSYIVDDIISWHKGSLGLIWGGGSLDDNFMMTKWELGISELAIKEKTKTKQPQGKQRTINTYIVYCVQWCIEQIYVVCELRWMHTSCAAPAFHPPARCNGCCSVNAVEVKCNIQVLPGAPGVKKIVRTADTCAGPDQGLLWCRQDRSLTRRFC